MVTFSDDIFRDLDKEFEVVIVTPDSRNYGYGVTELVIMDSRSKTEIRAEIQNVYKRNTRKTNC